MLKHEFWNIIIQKYHALLGNVCVIYFLWVQRKLIFKFTFSENTLFFPPEMTAFGFYIFSHVLSFVLSN